MYVCMYVRVCIYVYVCAFDDTMSCTSYLNIILSSLTFFIWTNWYTLQYYNKIMKNCFLFTRNTSSRYIM